jgi:hypothetical protein
MEKFRGPAELMEITNSVTGAASQYRERSDRNNLAATQRCSGRYTPGTDLPLPLLN